MALICPESKSCTLASSCFHSEPHEEIKFPMMDEVCTDKVALPCGKGACIPVEEERCATG